jgi:hypothetical protein
MLESSNKFYQAVPDLVQETMDEVSKLTGRPMHLFDYYGHPEAEYVVVAMGSGCQARGGMSGAGYALSWAAHIAGASQAFGIWGLVGPASSWCCSFYCSCCCFDHVCCHALLAST